MPRKITYTDKENLVTKEVPAKNKCRAEDLNEIKSVVNDNSDDLTSVITEVTDARGTFNNLDSRIDSIETEVTNARGSFSSLNDRLDDIETEIAEDTITGEGENITLNGTAQNAMKIVIKGKTEQEQLSGKNLLDGANPTTTASAISSLDNNIITISSSVTTTIPYCSWEVPVSEGDIVRLNAIIQNSNGRIAKQTYDGSSWGGYNEINYIDGSSISSLEYTAVSGITKIRFNLYANNAVPSGAVSSNYKNVIVTKNNSDMTYEPYCGGVQSPNPSYPQTIHNVSGDLNVEIQNKNLAWTGWAQDFVNRVDSVNHANLQTFDNKNCLKYQCSVGYQVYDTKYMFKINFKPNTQYTFSFKLYPTTRFGDICIEHTDGTTIEALNLTANAWNDVVLTSSPNKTIKYLRANYREGYGTIDLDTFMVLEGAYTSQTIPPYIAHAEQNLPFTFSSGQALMQGGMLTDSGVYNERVKVDLSTLSWTESTTGKYSTWDLVSLAKRPANAGSKIGVKAEKYIEYPATTTLNQSGQLAILQNGVVVIVDTTGAPSGILEYEAVTPTTTAYTSTQQSQYNAIKNAISYNEQTNISSTSTDLSADLEAEAFERMSNQNYVTQEIPIGMWQGKTLYRKVIDIGVLPNNTTKVVSHYISNIDYIKSCTGYAMTSQGAGMNCPSNDVDFYCSTVAITVTTTADKSSFTTCFATIEYTKTTD